MSEEATATAGAAPMRIGLEGVASDLSDDKQVFHVPWGKAMMWIFLLSDTFIFSCFLIGYMKVRMTTTVTCPIPG